MIGAAHSLRRRLLVALGALAAACAPEGAQEPPPIPDAPRRIVSLDFCADQYVLKFAKRSSILALSPDATKDFSYMREAAQGLPQVRPAAEDALLLKPDLVVLSYGGGPNAARLFQGAGVPVVTVGWAGSIAEVQAGVRVAAAALGAAEEGERVAAEMAARVAKASANGGTSQSALYMTSTGVTAGPGALVHEMIEAAGLRNFQTAPGWRSLPLEQVIYDPPDLIATAFFAGETKSLGVWSAMRHPVARRLLETAPTIALDSAWTACGGWFLADAVEALAKAGQP